MDTNATIAALSAGADDGRRFDFLFAKLGARRLGMGELLADTIADLPEGERLFFTLYYFEELETSEIALILGETVFAVLQLHVSALVHLQGRLAVQKNRLPKLGGAWAPHSD
jgi:DNA-directed RNA polymerase specialized sigma24 family protein